MEEYGWSKEAPYKEIEMVVQDSKTLSNAINLVEADFKGRLINYGDNPVDKWCLSNSCLKLNDLRQALIVKTARENKIDGAVTLAIVYEMYRRYRSELANMIKGGNE
jgi:phage terminase large subunit-like protein